MGKLTRQLADRLSRQALWWGSRLAAGRCALRPAPQPASARPRLLILADRRGWAFDDLAQQRKTYMADTWDVDIVYLREEPRLDPSCYDLAFNPNWSYTKFDSLFHGRYVRGINSHKWQRASMPHAALRSCLRGAVACFVPNRAQLRSINPLFPASFLVKEGVDTRTFYWIKDRRSDELVVGWSGNAQNAMKRLHTVVRPACREAEVDLRVAQCPTREELNQFYNDVDLVLIASEPLCEGNPLSLFEAGACGRAVLATDVGCVPEMVDHRGNGLVVESTFDVERTVRAFVRELRWCKEHLGEVRAMGKRHRDKVLAERTSEKTSETFRQAIEWAYAHRWA